MLDNISGGRIELGVGMGYAPHEFRGFGLPVSRRVSLTDEGIAVLSTASPARSFSFHWQALRFRRRGHSGPRYVQPGGPPLWVAAMSEPGARRAARFDSNLLPQGARRWRWTRGARNCGLRPRSGENRVGIIRSCLVTDDPERDWPPVRAAERYRMSVYARFQEERAAPAPGVFRGNTRDARIPQTWVVGNVEHCVTELASFVRNMASPISSVGGCHRSAARTDERQPRTLVPRRGAATEASIGLNTKFAKGAQGSQGSKRSSLAVPAASARPSANSELKTFLCRPPAVFSTCAGRR